MARRNGYANLCTDVWTIAFAHAAAGLPILLWNPSLLYTSWCRCRGRPSLSQMVALARPIPHVSSCRCSHLPFVLVAAANFHPHHHCQPRSHPCLSGLGTLGYTNHIFIFTSPYLFSHSMAYDRGPSKYIQCLSAIRPRISFLKPWRHRAQQWIWYSCSQPVHVRFNLKACAARALPESLISYLHVYMNYHS